jgi:hypothetical protein
MCEVISAATPCIKAPCTEDKRRQRQAVILSKLASEMLNGSRELRQRLIVGGVQL